MKYGKLINNLHWWAEHCDQTNHGCQTRRILADAATAIEALRADLARVTAERDAAIADWHGFCVKCAWNGKQNLADGQMDDRCRTCKKNGKCNWEWRGKKED